DSIVTGFETGIRLIENAVVAGPTNGTLAMNANGAFTYTPNAGFSGIDTFTYTARDASGQISTTATVTLNVSPTATADSYTVNASTEDRREGAAGVRGE